MTPEQTITFIKILNQIDVLSFSGKDPVVLDLGDGAEIQISIDGSQFWWLNGEQHRIDGPAVIYPDGLQYWYLNGEQHRTDGPATIRANGTQLWYLNGQLHRTDGPAVIYADGTQLWWLDGREMIQEEHARRTGRCEPSGRMVR